MKLPEITFSQLHKKKKKKILSPARVFPSSSRPLKLIFRLSPRRCVTFFSDVVLFC